MHIANHIMQHIVLFDLVTRMPQIATLVNYVIRNKQAAPRSKFTAITRFYDLNISVKAKTTI